MKNSNKIEILNGIFVEKIEANVIRYELSVGIEVNKDVIMSLWDIGNKLCPIGKRKILIVFNSNFSPTKEAADFMVSEERRDKTIAEALCIDSGALKLLTNFYFRIKKPIIPSRVFNDEKKALAWLNEQM